MAIERSGRHRKQVKVLGAPVSLLALATGAAAVVILAVLVREVFFRSSAVTIPTVSAVTPGSGLMTGGEVITVKGTGFASGARVLIVQGGATPQASSCDDVDVVSSTELRCTTLKAEVAGSGDVYVTTSQGTSAKVRTDHFAYRMPPPPTVTSISPDSGPVTGGTHLTVTGTNFVGALTVVIPQGNGLIDTIPCGHIDVVSTTTLTCTTGGGAKAGQEFLIITTAGGSNAIGKADVFTYTAPPATSTLGPSITAVTPDAGPTSGGTHITITGSGFSAGARVVIAQGVGTTGGIACSNVDVVSSSTITCTTGGGATAGTWNIFVITPAGTTTPNSAAGFAYYAS